MSYRSYIFIFIILISTTALGNDIITGTESTKRNIGDFIDPDGYFDLELAQKANFSGSLDMGEHVFLLDPKTNEPILLPGNAKSHPDDIYWDNTISPCFGGVDGTVEAMIIYQDKLYIGGMFEIAGCSLANNIAYWDGENLNPLGDGLAADSINQMYGTGVFAFEIFNDKLVVAGKFDSAGTIRAKNIASWDGTSWESLGAGIYGLNGFGEFVSALTVYDGNLIAGGIFDSAGNIYASSIASWNGSVWGSLGPGITGNHAYSIPSIKALAVYRDTLVAAGYFTAAGSVDALNIASWDGVQWDSLGTGLNGEVYALEIFDDRLMAGGYINNNGPGYQIGAWDGVSWNAIGTGYDLQVFSFTIYNDRLIAGGRFSEVNGVDASGVASWDGITWKPLSGGTLGDIYSLSVFEGNLFAGGRFSPQSALGARNIAYWDGYTWSHLVYGFLYSVHALAYYNGGLYAGTISRDDAILAFCVYNDDLYVGGIFDSFIGIPANNIARYDGVDWSPVGAGINGQVYDLLIFDNKLIASGIFTSAGGIPASAISSWDGAEWDSLGSGMANEGSFENPFVSTLSTYNGKLIAGGKFDHSGGIPANFIASWDGVEWDSLGSGLTGYGTFSDGVHALAEFEDKLYVGGTFNNAGGVSVECIATWDGENWEATPQLLSGPEYPNIAALCVHDNLLFAGGNFILPGDSTESYCATWDGAQWSPLGSGTNAQVLAFLSDEYSIISGGYFTVAGGKVSVYLAQWMKFNFMCGDANGDESVNVGDAAFLINYIFREGQAPAPLCIGDANSDGLTNVGDAVYLINYIFREGQPPLNDCCGWLW